MSASEESSSDPWTRWDDRTDDWLAAVLDTDSDSDPTVIDYEFPSDTVRRHYLETIHSRSDNEIRNLLRLFLVPNGSFPGDVRMLSHLAWCLKHKPDEARRLVKIEFFQRLLFRVYRGGPPPWEGVTWILDLIPDRSDQAIQVLKAYLRVHAHALPDGRYGGILDSQAIIQAKWLSPPGDIGETRRRREIITSLSPRELEHLTETIYHAMGYKTRLTPAQGDGGRDVEVSKLVVGEAVTALIECKKRSRPVSVDPLRSLLGVVSETGLGKGVLVTSGSFTRGAIDFADRNRRLELLDGAALVDLLDLHVGPHWATDIVRLLDASVRRNER